MDINLEDMNLDIEKFEEGCTNKSKIKSSNYHFYWRISSKFRQKSMR